MSTHTDAWVVTCLGSPNCVCVCRSATSILVSPRLRLYDVHEYIRLVHRAKGLYK